MRDYQRERKEKKEAEKREMKDKREKCRRKKVMQLKRGNLDSWEVQDLGKIRKRHSAL